MFWAFTAIAAFVLIFGGIKSAFTKPYDGGCLDDIYQYKHDKYVKHLSRAQLEKNIREGKYKLPKEKK